MIHDVTIPFSFDTSPIERQIANIGEQEVKRLIHDVTLKGIYSVLPKNNGWYRETPKNDDEVNWKQYLDAQLDKWFAKNSQAIIDEAALLMAMRAGRTTQWRKVLEELKAERDAE